MHLPQPIASGHVERPLTLLLNPERIHLRASSCAASTFPPTRVADSLSASITGLDPDSGHPHNSTLQHARVQVNRSSARTHQLFPTPNVPTLAHPPQGGCIYFGFAGNSASCHGFDPTVSTQCPTIAQLTRADLLKTSERGGRKQRRGAAAPAAAAANGRRGRQEAEARKAAATAPADQPRMSR